MSRVYKRDDWAAVREIYDLSKPDEMRNSVPVNAILPLAKNPEMLRLFQESQIIVAEEKEEIVGFAGYKGSFIFWLYVHPNHRKKGVASLLVNRMIQCIDGSAQLNVAKANVDAIRLYSQLGFVVKSEYVGQFNGYPCEVIRMRYGESTVNG